MTNVNSPGTSSTCGRLLLKQGTWFSYLINISNGFYPVKRILEQDFGVLKNFDLFNFQKKNEILAKLNCLINGATVYQKREKKPLTWDICGNVFVPMLQNTLAFFDFTINMV